MSSLFFFDTDKALERSKVTLRSPLPTPETGWRPPRDFPNLTNAYVIGRDRETREFDFDNGPGWARGTGYVVGEAITAFDRDLRPTSWYFPKHHEVEPEYNMNADQVTAYCCDVDQLPQTKIYANVMYDDGYGTDEANGGKPARGEKHDVQFAEALLSETDLTALDALGQKYLSKGKESNKLYEWAAACYGGNPTRAQRANIYRCSPRLVAPYAMEDSAMTLPILLKQVPLLKAQDLYHIYRMECDIAELLILMRKRGVRVDLAKAEKLYAEMGDSMCADTPCNNPGVIAALERKLFDMTGIWVNTESALDLEKAFNAVGVKFPRTEITEQGGGGNPSFTAEFLNACEHPIGDAVVEIRQHKKLKSTFLRSYILESHNKGRVHGQYHPLKGSSEGGSSGTRVGRLSSSTPNLQNIPSRTALGRQIRTMFVPDHGSLCLEKGDHSQLQYRILAHFAVDALGNNRYGDGPASNALRAEYNINPHTDYHSRTQNMVKAVSGLYIPRSSEEASQGQVVCPYSPGTAEYKAIEKDFQKMYKETGAEFETSPWSTNRFTIKETNFGLMFGMGKRKLIRQSQLPVQKGEDVFAAYHQGNPYVKATMDYFSFMAQTQGWVPTIMGRRTRFDKWVKKDFHDPPLTPLNFGAALAVWGPGSIERAWVYKALCNVLQGTEGEIIKRGMLQCYQEGLYDVLGYPLLTTHDEVVLDIPNDSPEVREARKRARWVMENAIRLRVPLVYESTTGPTWGDAKTPIEEKDS
jgi:DNA polymerase I-like protein with 3'-5' exonuclease and polymerase domains